MLKLFDDHVRLSSASTQLVYVNPHGRGIGCLSAPLHRALGICG